MRKPLRTILLFTAAFLMAFAALTSLTIAVPHLREDMLEINVRPTLLGAVMMGLHFGTFAMFGFTALVLVAAIQSLRGFAAYRIPLLLVAVTYVAFGIFAFVSSGNHHTLAYVLIGVFILGATAIRDANRGPEPGQPNR
jgi:predicted ferric reductase